MINIIWLVAAIAVWGVVHSWLAALGTKAFLERLLGQAVMRFYRLFYNLFAIISFLPILWLMISLPDWPVYQVPAPWRGLMIAGQGVAAYLLVLGVFQTGAFAFAGLSQLVDGDQPASLVTGGLYRFVRHPLYTAGLLFLWLTPKMSVNTLTVYAASSIYLVVGALFEERKLLREFGAAYQSYRQVTPMFVPRLTFRRK